METQGWPLWATRRGSRAVYAVIGWEYRTEHGRMAIGILLGQPTLGRAAELGGSDLVFTGDEQQAWVLAMGSAEK